MVSTCMLWALRARARAERCPSRTDATVVDQRSTSWKQPIVRRGLDYKYSAAFGCLCDGGGAVRVQRVEQTRPASDQHGAAVGRLTELPSEPHHPYLWGTVRRHGERVCVLGEPSGSGAGIEPQPRDTIWAPW